MKYLFYWVLLTGSLSASAQNMRVLQQFDKILLGSQKFEIEGYMSSYLMEYKKDETNNRDLGYEYISYISKMSSMQLNFHKGILYLKRLIIYYPKEGIEEAKIEYENINKYIILTSKVLSEGTTAASNPIYGKTGSGKVYSLSNSSTKRNVKSITMCSRLSFDFKANPPIGTISGYELIYEWVDLSKTELDATIGYMDQPMIVNGK